MEIGDKVKISNYGKIYTTYNEMFRLMKFKNKKENPLGLYILDDVYEIFDIRPPHSFLTFNSTTTTLLCGIRKGKREYLFNMEGLSLFEKKDKLNSWRINKIKEFKTLV